MLSAFFCFALFTYHWRSSYFSSTSKRSLELLISAAGLTVNGRGGLWDAARPPRRPELPGSLPRRPHSLVVQRSPSRVPPAALALRGFLAAIARVVLRDTRAKLGESDPQTTAEEGLPHTPFTMPRFYTFGAGRCLHERIAVPSQSRLFVGQFVGFTLLKQ